MVSINDTMESMTIKLKLGNRWLHLNTTYIPPNASDQMYSDFSQYINNTYSAIDDENELVVLGDFNLNEIEWIPDDDNEFILNPSNIITNKSKIVLDTLSDLGLNQIFNVKNNFGNVLDLCFVSMLDDFSVTRSYQPLKNDSAAHKSMEINLIFHNFIEDEMEEYFYEQIMFLSVMN